LRVGLSQLMFVVAGLVLGIFVPGITVPPTVSSGRIVDLLFTAGVTVISLITVIYSLLFVVVQWVGSAFSLRLSLFRDDPIVWRAFAYSIGVFVFCFTAAFAIGNRKTVSVLVPKGVTSAGVPQDQAVAAVFIQRLFTAYLPPIWGYVTLAWMRRREYV
jgi:uncharacterized membrane protein